MHEPQNRIKGFFTDRSQDGIVPKIGSGHPVGGRKRRTTVSVREALKEPGFAAREFGIGVAIGGGILFGVLGLFLVI